MDEEIIRRVLNGDLEAFGNLIRKYKDASFGLAKSIIKEDLSAEEAVQDAFIRAFQHLHKFRMKAAFSTWLYRIVVNESLKRVNQSHLENKTVSLNNSHADSITIDPQAIEYLDTEEQREIIRQTLDRLRPNESLLLKLFYLEEKNMEEIKHITGLSVSNIKVILHRARKSFAVHFQPHVHVN